jgi:tyrosinase
MPDGKTANPLAAPPRERKSLNVPWFIGDINLAAMKEHWFSGAPRGLGFGGGSTDFNHSGGDNNTGALEDNPHNTVHVLIDGFMGGVQLAALDPIFWLHHCNIDRLWEAWLSRPDNIQENRSAWRDGPIDPVFQFPDKS